ncbi:MAG: cytochrome C oxidase subunit IV family protein [Planctomycetota bacterium]|jgi:cytochrome c oxidase subunit 4
MADSHAQDIDKHVRTYIIVFVSLMALTIVTVAVAFIEMPVWMAIAVALFIASVKGSLVACYFMHLISEKKLILVTLIFTVFFFVGLLLLPVFTNMDAIEL